jgi:hypothetical protein
MTIDYCYTMGGAERPDYALLARLREHGFTTLWSYCDSPRDSLVSLNAIGSGGNAVRAMAPVLARHLRARHMLITLHMLRSMLYGHLHGTRGILVWTLAAQIRDFMMKIREKRGASASDFRTYGKRLRPALLNALRNPPEMRDQFTRAQILAATPVIYPERPSPLGQVRATDMMLFATNYVVHTEDAYYPSSLDDLISERGVHIGHCYLLNRVPYLAGIFSPGTSRTSEAWNTFIDALAGHVKSGRLLNPVVSDLAEWFRGLQFVEAMPTGDNSMQLVNHGRERLRGYTLLIPRVWSRLTLWGGRPPAGSRPWSDWLAVWGDLDSGESVKVEW